jgi:hypothetical protein
LSFPVTEARDSPDGRHNAVLRRADGIDVNFELSVDGRRVFWSPDFAPVSFDFREKLVWDRSSRRVVLEVAGERIFGYDAEEKRPLTADEIISLEYVPFQEFRYEGTLPRRPSK